MKGILATVAVNFQSGKVRLYSLHLWMRLGDEPSDCVLYLLDVPYDLCECIANRIFVHWSGYKLEPRFSL